MRIAYLFTTFPKLSERFFLREVAALRARGLELEVYSMIGGEAVAEAGAVRHFRALDWLMLVPELAGWLLRRPGVSAGLLWQLRPWRYRSLTNWGENALGLALAVRFARHFAKRGYRCTHATWATAPAMASDALRRLVGLPYTMEAHAYDVFRDGGDALLEQKLAAAQCIRSSTEATASELRKRMEMAGISTPVVCIRRGLDAFPEMSPPQYAPGAPLRVLSVGRLIEKKGYLLQLAVFREWQRRGIAFRAEIVGEGPLRSQIETRIRQYGLVDQVTLTGKLSHAEVDRCYRSADLFLFCGQVSASGDRDGFPNVIGEAMAYALPVFTTDVSGTTEGVVDGETGYVIDLADAAVCAERIHAQMQDAAALQRVTTQALDWLHREFSTAENVRRLAQTLWGAD